jgi:tRNA(Ile)-lysidine synthase
MQRELTDTTSRPDTRPLSDDEINALMMRFKPWPKSIALAVSGGPDSMAMAVTLKRWADNHNIQTIAITVDHALRPESAKETLQTQQRLGTIGVPCRILRWEHQPVTTGLHAAARKARYSLLVDACREHHIHHLITAHQREDQAETILMRFAKGSGIDGLSGIATITQLDDIFFWRPFLLVSKARMMATCDAAQIGFITDPSNLSERFARGRLRRVMPLLAEEGLTIDRLIDLGHRATSVKDALEQVTNTLLCAATSRDIAGTVSGDILAFQSAPRAIAERALTKCLQHIHHENYPPEHDALSSLLDALLSEENLAPRTLHGCVISKNNKSFCITPELSAIEVRPIKGDQPILWNKIWKLTVDLAMYNGDYEIRPLGLLTHKTLDAITPGLSKLVPLARARACLPSLWLGETLVCGPSLTGSAIHQTGLTAERKGSWP